MIYSLITALFIREEIFLFSSFMMYLSSFGSINNRVYPFPLTVSSHKDTEFKILRVSILICSKCSGMVNIYSRKISLIIGFIVVLNIVFLLEKLARIDWCLNECLIIMIK